MIEDQKAKYDEILVSLEQTQKDGREQKNEVFKMQNTLEETVDQLETTLR